MDKDTGSTPVQKEKIPINNGKAHSLGRGGGAMRCQNPKWGGDGLPSKSQMAQRPTKIFYFS